MQIKSTVITSKAVVFWNSIFSNFHDCNFIYKGIWFKSSEQAFMWEKARHFNDLDSCVSILKAQTPKAAKDLGRAVKNFDNSNWESVRYAYMVEVLKAKFGQNKGLKQNLLDTESRTLIEGSPQDKVWGIGIHWEDPDCLDKSKWKGQNLLGKALMEVRQSLKDNE